MQCPNCRGTGYEPVYEPWNDCPDCDGAGRVSDDDNQRDTDLIVGECNALRREARLLRTVVDSMPGSYIEAWSLESEEALRALSRAASSQERPA